MKICIAQTKPVKGNIPANIQKHKTFIELACSFNSIAIFFPELSLTGYEPKLAKELATNQDDARFLEIQQISDQNNIFICPGIPTKSKNGIHISMIVFQPYSTRQIYSKQYLHSDELPYFEAGDQQKIIKAVDHNIAPAICFESLVQEHSSKAKELGAQIYMATVAKSGNGLNKALTYYPVIAETYSMPVLMSNCIGYCDNFNAVGSSAVWSKQGRLLGQLDDTNEGIIIFDTESEEVIIHKMK